MDTRPHYPPTICALATPPGRGAVGIVRLSGQHLLELALKLSAGQAPKPRYALVTDFLAEDGSVIDRGLMLYFPAPYSFTGEDVLELQGHGGPVVLHCLLRRCVALGAQLAQPGEFSQRAFLNGKIDLAQAESIADLIDASSVAAAQSALRSLKGAFSNEIDALNHRLMNLRMQLEATLDFPEEDIDELQECSIQEPLKLIQQRLAEIRVLAHQGSILREGGHIVLIGPPNVGKSSLINALAAEDLSIVTASPGTTRDAVRADIVIDGVPLHIIDTAGLRETVDPVEQIGIDRSWQTLEQADVALLLIDSQIGLQPYHQTILSRCPSTVSCIWVWNKIDLLLAQEPTQTRYQGQPAVYVSAKTLAGIDLLKKQLLEAIGFKHTVEGVFLARSRHLQALEHAAQYLGLADDTSHTLDLCAEQLRLAHQALATITGQFTADDLLGEIFSRFCIGK